MAQYRLQVNGHTATVESWDPAQPLLYVLRNALGLHSPKFGCGLGQCGACTVLLDGTPTRSCITSVEQALGHTITTLEGLGTPEQPHPLQTAFIAEQAMQCGYCVSGILISAAGLLARNANPDEAEVRAALDRNLCRCGAHNRMVRAVLRAAREGRAA